MLSKNKKPAHRYAAIAVAALIVLSGPRLADAGYNDDIGYAALQAELGAATPTGAGVAVSQVEGAVVVNTQYTWMPDATQGEFAGKTIINESGAPAGLYSGHATGVGAAFYGLTISTAPGIGTISAHHVDAWLGNEFLWVSGGQRPAASSRRIANHSWTADAGSFNSEALRRLDWVIETDDMVQVVGLNNGSGAINSPLLSSAMNVIAAGRSDGVHAIGSVAVDATYTAGRTRPDIVVPSPSTSSATPRLSSAVALLVDTGHGDTTLSTDPTTTSFVNRAGLLIRNAERSEVIKAALMAGADRVTRNSSSANLALYRSAGNQSGNGLDRRYGAGQLDIYNSYHIIASGEQNSAEDGGTGSGAASRGFDYDPAFGGANGTNSVSTYALPVSSSPQLLTAALVVNLDINGGTPSSFDGTAYFRDLSLAVVDVTDSGNPVTVVTSQSTIENTENAWLVVPANARYVLRVARAGATAFNYNYALAWQLLPDTDGDGAHDGQDNCIGVANGPIVPDAGGNSQRDGDADGYGNVCDGDLNNSGLVTSADFYLMRSALNTSDPVADLNGSGVVTSTDYNLLRALLNTAPGPSAHAQ